MILHATARQVWDGFRSNRLRFALTLLGVVIGTSSLVLLANLLSSGRDALTSASREATDDDLVKVVRSRPRGAQRNKTTRQLDQADATALESSALLEGARASHQRYDGFVQLSWQGRRRQAVIIGADTQALSLHRLELARGRFFSDEDLRERRQLAVVGHRVWQDLFGEAPLGDLEVRTATDRFRVIGVLAPKPTLGGSDGPWTWDGRVLLPLSTFDIVMPPRGRSRRDVDEIHLRLGVMTALTQQIDEVRTITDGILFRRHHEVRNFQVAGLGKNDGKEDLILAIVSALLLATALLALLVGGINVMNIMLVTVTERTREIGIRRALGAPRRLILAQFLVEACVTSGLGGVLGIACGVGLSGAAAVILRRVIGFWPFHVVPWAPPLALAVAVGVGAVFGLYPAWRASRLDPVEALRFE